jgi:hypothetical protein
VSNTPETRIAYKKFAVESDAYCAWDWHLGAQNVQYIKSIEPTYFEYIAEANKGGLESEHKGHAATAIRTGYHQGLETLFALLFAALQAPGCVVGWMLKYRIEQLRTLVRSVDTADVPRYLAVVPDPFTWEGITQEIFSRCDGDPERINREKARFARIWRGFAKEFLTQNHHDEYNSIKHGLRVASGPTSVYIALQEGLGKPANIEDAQKVGGGQFGSSFFVDQEIRKPDLSRLPRDRRRNFALGHSALNWDAESLCVDLEWISTSIHNIRTYLLTLLQVPGPPPTYLSRDEEARPSQQEVGSVKTKPNITEAQTDPFNEDQILGFYDGSAKG